MQILKVFFLILTLSVFTIKTALAQSEFSVDSKVEYKIDVSGDANVTNTISIKNNKSEVFPKAYSLIFRKYKPDNLKVYENANLLKVKPSQSDDIYTYMINFENLDVGVNTTKTFLVTYELPGFAQKTADTWEVNIPVPENSEDYSDYSIFLSVPRSFGKESFLSQKPTQTKEGSDTNLLVFGKSESANSGIYVSFGEFKTYNFDITFHLENPLEKKSYTEIAIIPDTDYQRVYYKDIRPKPIKIFKDIDGNWIAGFNFKPREKIEVKTTGFVQVFSKEVFDWKEIDQSYLDKNTEENLYWEVNDPQIQAVSSNLKTPRDIYNYLVANMTYNESRVNDFKFERMGAKDALTKMDQSLCLEFTDSFVAIARAMGIPAREINGFALSSDKLTQPLSLVSDVLHAWPEYWDKEKKAWVPVDPTWGKTSGLNYFDSFDVNHIVFAIHGTSSTTPHAAGTYKLGPEPGKDVIVSQASSPPEKKQENVDIYHTSISAINPFTENIEITITNSGNSALYQLKTLATSENNNLLDKIVPQLLPFESYTTTVKVPYKFLGFGMPNSIDYSVNGSITNIPLHKTPRVIIHLVLVFILLSLILVFVIRYIQLLLKFR